MIRNKTFDQKKNVTEIQKKKKIENKTPSSRHRCIVQAWLKYTPSGMIHRVFSKHKIQHTKRCKRIWRKRKYKIQMCCFRTFISCAVLLKSFFVDFCFALLSLFTSLNVASPSLLNCFRLSIWLAIDSVCVCFVFIATFLIRFFFSIYAFGSLLRLLICLYFCFSSSLYSHYVAYLEYISVRLPLRFRYTSNKLS